MSRDTDPQAEPETGQPNEVYLFVVDAPEGRRVFTRGSSGRLLDVTGPEIDALLDELPEAGS
jgi:hypothetical protein